MGFMDISIGGSDTASDFDWTIGRCKTPNLRKKMMMQEAKKDHGEWNTPGFVNVALCLVDGKGVSLLDYPWDKEWYDFMTKMVTVLGESAMKMKQKNPEHAKVLKRLFQVLFKKVEDCAIEEKENNKNS